MFKRLRNRFLLMHMGIVSLLIVLFFGSLLLTSYNTLERSTDEFADRLWRSYTLAHNLTIISAAPVTDRFFAGQAHVQSANQQGGQLAADIDNQPNGQLNIEFFAASTEDASAIVASESVRSGVSIPNPFTTRDITSSRLAAYLRVLPGIFIVTDDQQAIVSVESPYNMNEAFYTTITNEAYRRAKPSGKLSYGNVQLKYRYADNQLLFIDVSQESALFAGVLSSFLMIALPLLVLLFFLSLFFANRSIRPIETSYNRQKEFIADASHELKSPLAAISTNLEVLNGLAEPEQKKWLGYIQSEVKRMAGLTNSLLYLAKMDYGMPKAFLPLDMGKLFEAIWLPLEAVLFEKGVKADTHIEPGVFIDGEEEQIVKLIGILTDNAVRYASERITVALEKQQNNAVLTLTNDGPGIPQAELGKIWERFYRCDQARQYDGGYGLGLPMARAITERHNGRIYCESIPGKHTSFVVKLPSGGE